MWLDNNQITGTIPTEIALLTDLASLSMAEMDLVGTIPREVGNSLSRLRRAWLYNNKLVGTIPMNFNQLSFLEVFEIHGNEITGYMPQDVCTFISSSLYEFKSLTSDCVSEIVCDCCTVCY